MTQVSVASHQLLWTELKHGEWAIQVCSEKSKPVRIYHLPCYEKSGMPMWWWSKISWETQGLSQKCFECDQFLPDEDEEYLLKAWGLYVL